MRTFTRHRSLGSTAAATAALAAAALLAGIQPATAQPNAAPSATPLAQSTVPTAAYGAAPYVMPTQNDPPDLPTVMRATGQRTFELAFILAPNGGGCSPTWGGTSPVASDTAVGNTIEGVRAAGGDVSISIGGYGGTKLGQTCSNAGATAAAYQQVIDKYKLKAVDFDLEEPEYENSSAVANELGAAQILQQNNAGLYVSVTMPGTTAGTGYFGQQLLNEAKSLGFTPDNYSIMPFDGGFTGAAAQSGALTSFHTLLMSTFGWNATTAYRHEGVSLMNGRSDTGEQFQPADFQTVLDYATSNGMSRFSFWSVNRDRQCTPPDNNGRTSGSCSSVAQHDWQFTGYTASFAGSASGPPPPTTTPPPPAGCSASSWDSSVAYTGGSTVSYAQHSWAAKWWTQGDTPGGAAGVWIDEGSC